MRRRALAPAFVTTLLTGGCAWTYGGGVQYGQRLEGPGGVGGFGRVAWGLGGGRTAVTLAADLGLGYSPSARGVWVQSSPRVEYARLPGAGGVGVRAGVGGLVAGAGGAVAAGPGFSGELLYGLDVMDDPDRGYRATALAFGAQVALDLTGERVLPVFVLSVSVTREGLLPFGNPPRMRAPTNVMAVDPR